jgi:hypothetical protein
LNWIIEIFSDKSEQAKLIAILISAVIAVLVVLLNQWFISRRAKRELLIEKIEELFTASNEYISACRELMDSLKEQGVGQPDKYYDYPQEIVNKLNDSITKMQMICGLYFKSEKFDPDEFYIWRMPILNIAHKGIEQEEGEGYIEHENSLKHIADSRKKLDSLCMDLMKKYGH